MANSITPWESIVSQKRKKIFVASCLLAVLVDPLFLYVPMMKDDIKCLQSDRNLKIAALLLRSFTDLFYIFDIIFQIYTSKNFSDHEYRRRYYYYSKIRFWRKYDAPTIAKTIWGSYIILIDILAILPVPQVAILIFFLKRRDLRSLNKIRMVTMNFIVLWQYVPRVFRIYLSCKKLKQRESEETQTSRWIKGGLNFFMYILASHVLGGIWYFFAIQRMVTCWHNACRKENGCDASTFDCRDHHTFRNITFLNDICPISPVNVGIYITVLQSGIPGSTNFFQKFSNCFWLGLRHLSSFGSNLEPSVDEWENLFAASISIIGLLLFLYFLGNLQTYMQLGTAIIEKMKVERTMKMKVKRKEEIGTAMIEKKKVEQMERKKKMKVERKMEEKGREIELWLSGNGIPRRLNKNIKSWIMDKVRQELEENKDTDLDNILSMLPLDLQSSIKSWMPMGRLKQVPMLQNMDERVLRRICPYLKPREFDDNSIIIEKGKPLEMMLFIVDGFVSIEKRDGSSSNNNLQQGAEEVCGEELLLWPLSVLFWVSELTLATESAKAIGHVEALVLTAEDLEEALALKEMEMYYFVGIFMSKCRKFSAKELEKATDNYHQSRIIRRGTFATFYKGVLPDDDKTVVAVKKYATHIDYRDVAIEAAVACQTSHINVVRFLGGFLEEGKDPALVFEYIPNGTLFEHIHKEEAGGSFEGSSSSPTALLSLELRLKIASETAGALAYLHSLTPPIIHLCLSTKHILLDDHYTAKLSAIGRSLTLYYSGKIPELGSWDPCFEIDGLAEKSDVYSFGVILAELLTSQKPASPNSEGEEPPLATCILSSIKEDRLDQILDGEIIVNEASSETAKKVGDLAKRCLSSERVERPSMEQVVVELERLRKLWQSIKGDNPVSQTGQP